MIQATEAVFSYDEHWQSHFHCQISDKIIRADRNHPTSNPFDENIVNPSSQRLKRAEQGLDVDLHIFNLSGGQRRGRCFSHSGLISSIVRPSALAPNRR